MATPAELALMETRKNAARSATKFFEDIKGVRSTNNPFDFTTAAEGQTLAANRVRIGNDNTIITAFDEAAQSGIGNCDEKGRICYAALRSNPMIGAPGSHVSLVEAINYDHVFVVVANAQIAGAVNLNQIGLTAMIVDGWTQDWYFPNLGVFSAKWHGLGNTPNPRQAVVRSRISSHQFQSYGGVGNMVPDF